MKSLDELIDPVDKAQPAQPAPHAKPRVTAIIVLSMLLGVLLTLIAVGAFVHLQTSRALEAQVLAVEDELKARSLALDDLKLQIAMLSKHIQMLKEYAIARSVGPGDAEKAAPPASRAKASPNCELAGKSPEQQAVVLQRCVGLTEPPGEKPAKR